MIKTIRTNRVVVAILGLVLIALAGCGSSASTNAREVAAITTAEGKFLAEWANAAEEGRKRCRSSDEVHVVGCDERVVEPLQMRAMKRYKNKLERQLERDLGPKCSEALEEALYTIPSAPSFAGTTAAACRSESES